MHTLFRMSYLSQILDTPERLCMRVPTCHFLKIKKKKKKRNTAKIREQEESNTLLQNKESIHTLNNNSLFENE